MTQKSQIAEQCSTGVPPVIDPIRGSAAVQGAWASRPHRSNPVVPDGPSLLSAFHFPPSTFSPSALRAPLSPNSHLLSSGRSAASLLSAFSPRGMQSLFHQGQLFSIFPGPRVRPSRSVGVSPIRRLYEPEAPPTSRPPRNADAPVGPLSPISDLLTPARAACPSALDAPSSSVLSAFQHFRFSAFSSHLLSPIS
jgi:hypothetical protein